MSDLTASEHPWAVNKPYPTPEVPEPEMYELEEWVMDGVAEATDGCRIEPDGVCQHGHPSWLLKLGYI